MRDRVASVSLDLDNLWSYMKIHGDPGWQSHPSYLDIVGETIVDRMRQHGLTITVFVVGQDAALDRNRAALRAISDAGHEIGNHSFSHEPWFHEFTDEETHREIALAEEHIERATGQRPRGFRGPGFSLSQRAVAVLSSRGYLYDASTFPTFLGPIARAYYFWNARHLTAAEKAKRKNLYGTTAEGLRPLKPYRCPETDLLEIPVTTMPLSRMPMHMSYIVYLALRSPAVAMTYLHTALALCRARGVEPSFLLHPLDFVSGDKVKELSFFPGMNTTTQFKLELFDRIIDAIRASFEPVTMAEHARRARQGRLERRSLA